jgi:hypothetical protein
MERQNLSALIWIIFFSAQAAQAGDLYRCGSTYQDTPCQNAKLEKNVKKIVAPSANQASMTSSIKIDFDCKQKGEKAKKIMWMREVGRTADEQIASPPDGASPSLIKEVYSHRGSSLEVRNTIEQTCMEQKERDKLAAQMIAEAQRLRAGNASAPATNENLKPTNDEPIFKDEIPNRLSDTTNSQAEKCNHLKERSIIIADKKRTGGSAKLMENLRREQNEVNEALKMSGC